jgi:hypothetical protein
MKKIKMQKNKENKINTITPRFVHGNPVKGENQSGGKPTILYFGKV